MSYNQGGYGQQGGGYGQQQNHSEAAEFYNQGANQGGNNGYAPNNGYGQQQHGGQQYGGGQGGYGQGPPQYQQLPSAAAHSSNSGRNSHNQGYQNQYGGEGDPEGDRGIMGGIAGGAAGAFGGHKLGGQAGHGTAGTIIGAISGAFAGHKAQDKVSDWKDERDEKKKWEKEQEEQQKYNQQHHSSSPPQHHHQQRRDSDDQRERGNFGGNFTASSRDIRLDAHGDYVLHAQCARTDGSYQSSSISLNKVIENDNGSFRWSQGSSNGSQSYTVQQGDTLRAIADRFSHCSFEELARHNNIANPDQIWPGQNLQIPGGGSRGGGNFGASARNVRLQRGGQELVAELGPSWHTRTLNLDERIGNRNGCLEFV